ncbi:hypothetical protein NJB14197_33990 [Mycobacterium montefiorense]|uniref:Uncharacterized protein n=1 Tax=Mycobacterium montefiorense TaxID=154654 RepID=A0AA37PJM9_9MYCO|nr:hypothetical protein MmonteBS_29000 [Mycobacterium montefiorense]GKU34356.1 hypothetical protein NJB14191_17020 [Mycobacterium montefiorense]GKU38977.1 hypothetical protein NJB14192_09730 [Mycobacterium montefiorense]GKU47985.1 hypothetical protein NJB14194_46020 [Mycobacterium montefiorense]GKU49742.1 hypothetical protein NJB14195_09880 [Mycobacterium montefiorense]
MKRSRSTKTRSSPNVSTWASSELFKTALRLARHRELVDGADRENIAKRRKEFADEIATATRRVNAIAELARTQ